MRNSIKIIISIILSIIIIAIITNIIIYNKKDGNKIPESNTYGYAADTKMRLNIDKMRKLGWTPRVGLEEAYRRLIGSMVQTNE